MMSDAVAKQELIILLKETMQSVDELSGVRTECAHVAKKCADTFLLKIVYWYGVYNMYMQSRNDAKFFRLSQTAIEALKNDTFDMTDAAVLSNMCNNLKRHCIQMMNKYELVMQKGKEKLNAKH